MDHSILYALVCEKEISHMGKNKGNPNLVCEKTISIAQSDYSGPSTELTDMDSSKVTFNIPEFPQPL